nr:immunoglobulin heavy chain junction region [Mus musculus]
CARSPWDYYAMDYW